MIGSEYSVLDAVLGAMLAVVGAALIAGRRRLLTHEQRMRARNHVAPLGTGMELFHQVMVVVVGLCFVAFGIAIGVKATTGW